MKISCQKIGLKPPVVRESANFLQIIFERPPIKKFKEKQLPFDNRRKTDEKPTKNRRKTDEKSWSSEQEIKIIKFIEEHNKIRSKDIEILFNIKSTRAKEILKGMIDNGLIIKKGKTKGSFYILEK